MAIAFQNFTSFNSWITQFSALQKRSLLDVIAMDRFLEKEQSVIQISDLSFRLQRIFSRDSTLPHFYVASLVGDRNSGVQIGTEEKQGYFAVHEGILFGGMVQVGQNIFLADTGHHIIKKIDLLAHASSRYAGTESVAGSSNDTALAASFRNPTGLAYYNNTLYVADTGNHVIRAIDMSTSAVTTFAGIMGKAGNSTGSPTEVFFNAPTGITVNNLTGDVYVSDTGNHCIKKISSNIVSQILGESGVPGKTANQADAADFLSFKLNTPSTLVYSSQLNALFINDFLNKRILRLQEGGQVVRIDANDAYYGGLQTYQDDLGMQYLLYQDLSLGNIFSLELIDFGLTKSLSASGFSDYLGTDYINQSFLRDGNTYYVLGIQKITNDWRLFSLHSDSQTNTILYGTGGDFGSLKLFDENSHIYDTFSDYIGDAKIKYLVYRPNVLTDYTKPIEVLYKFLHGDDGTDSAIELSYSSVVGIEE